MELCERIILQLLLGSVAQNEHRRRDMMGQRIDRL